MATGIPTRYMFGSVSTILLVVATITTACTQIVTKPKTLEPSRVLFTQEILPFDYSLTHSPQALYEHAKVLVEQETGADLQHVTLDIVDDAVIARQVLEETSRLVQSQFTNNEYAKRYLQQVVADQSGTYTALYVHKTKQVLVNQPLLNAYQQSVPQNNTELKNKAELALYLHELAHAADDQQYKIHENRILNFKASFVQSAAFEGHAQLIARTICMRVSCEEGMGALEAFMFEEVPALDPVAQNVQAISRNVLEYSYVEGERFMTELQKMENGSDLIAQVMLSPPDDPIQILVPNTYPDKARELRNNRLKKALVSTDHAWNSPDWALVETSTIKGIDVRNNPERRDAAVEGFSRLIDSMSAAQLFDQTTSTIEPIDLMLIHTEDEATALLFAESFAQSSASIIESAGDEVDLSIKNSGAGSVRVLTATGSELAERPYTRISVRPVKALESKTDTKYHSTVIGISGQYVIQISGSFLPDLEEPATFARAVVEQLLSAN